VAEHEHENPRASQAAGERVVDAADLAEVDLRHVARRGLDGNGDVLGSDAALATDVPYQALHGPVRPIEVGMLEPQPVVDRARAQPLAHEKPDVRRPALQRRRRLRHGLARQCRLDCRFQHVELGDGLQGPAQQVLRGQREAIDTFSVRAHAQQARDLPRARLHPVEPHELLQSIHVDPPHTHPVAPPRSGRARYLSMDWLTA
jgi:hypothetical protein